MKIVDSLPEGYRWATADEVEWSLATGWDLPEGVMVRQPEHGPDATDYALPEKYQPGEYNDTIEEEEEYPLENMLFYCFK